MVVPLLGSVAAAVADVVAAAVVGMGVAVGVAAAVAVVEERRVDESNGLNTHPEHHEPSQQGRAVRGVSTRCMASARTWYAQAAEPGRGTSDQTKHAASAQPDAVGMLPDTARSACLALLDTTASTIGARSACRRHTAIRRCHQARPSDTAGIPSGEHDLP